MFWFVFERVKIGNNCIESFEGLRLRSLHFTKSIGAVVFWRADPLVLGGMVLERSLKRKWKSLMQFNESNDYK